MALEAAPIASSRVRGRERGGEGLHVERHAVGRKRHRPDRQAEIVGRMPPRVDVAVVIELGHHDLVARAPLSRERPRDMERDGRHVLAEAHPLRARGVEEGRVHPPGIEQERVGLLAARVHPVGVGVVVDQVLADRVDDRRGHLGAAGAVEVGHRVAVVHAAKGGELGADRFHVGYRHVGRDAPRRPVRAVRWRWAAPPSPRLRWTSRGAPPLMRSGLRQSACRRTSGRRRTSRRAGTRRSSPA